MKTEKKISGFTRFFKTLGPGLITGASDDDPSGIATYSQAGAQYGLGTLWTAWITFPLMASIQEMCARIGLATSRGLTSILKHYYPKWVLYLMLLFSFPAIVMNIGADIAGMGAVCLAVMSDAISQRAGVGLRARAPRSEENPKVCSANGAVGVQVGRNIGLTP